MQVCRVCLAMDRKMYALDSGRIDSYERITGLMCLPEDLLPKNVCWECKYYISKYDAFKTKAVVSQHVLQEIVTRDGLITDNTIRSLDQYQPTLTRTKVSYLYIKDEETENHVEIGKIDIKIESSNDDNHLDSSNNHFPDDLIDDIQSYKNEAFSKEKNNIDESLDIDKRASSITECYSECGINLFEDTEDFHDDDESIIKKSNLKKSKRKSRTHKLDTDYTDKSKNIQTLVNQPTVSRKMKKSKTVKNSKKANQEINKKCRKVCLKEKRTKSYTSKEYDKLDKTILTLTKLSSEEQVADMEKRKLNVFYRKSKFKCTDCFRGFSDEEKQIRHMEKHSESSGAYECKLCKVRFDAQCKLNIHMRGHIYKISCQQCSFSTGTLSAAMKHQNHHKGKQLICPHCNEVYTHRSTYLSHLRIKHPSNAICQYCGNSFVNERGLFLHKKYVHRFDEQPIPEDGPYCDKCDIRFLSQDALDTHRQSKHADEWNSTEDKLKKRKLQPSRSKPTSEPFIDGPKPCEQCDAKLPDPRSYFEHFRKEHKDKNRTLFYTKKAVRFMCEICGQMMQNAAHLQDHQYAHSGVKQFKCERCGKQFAQNAHLKLHQKNHCGDRTSYPCTVCGKAFTNQSNVRRHMISHTGVRAFKCEMCDKTFVHMGNKKAHVDFVHKKKPWPKRNRGARRRTERLPEIMQQNICDEPDIPQEWSSAS